MLVAIALLVAGLAILPLSADRFVIAATRISRTLGLSPILVGALLVGFGTSLPEIVVSGIAAGQGDIDFAVGNIVGSNVANLGLVLGVAALMRPVVGELKVLRREGVLVLIVTALYVALHFDDDVQRWEAALLLGVMALALFQLVRWSRDDMVAEVEPRRFSTIQVELAFGVASMVLVVVAATILIEGAERLADELGIESAFIAATLVALGTSLPELATAIAAIRRREGDLVLGNVLGSNLFNVLAVGGVAGLVGPGPISDGFEPLLLTMLVVTAGTGVLVRTGNVLSRWEGALLLVAFAAFVAVAGQTLA